jgi:hypothetical protein
MSPMAPPAKCIASERLGILDGFADDTQLINKTEESIEETFKTLEIYEKASGAKMNLEKTVGMYLGKWRKTNDLIIKVFPKYVRSLDFQTSIQLFILFIFSNQIISKSIAYPWRQR